MEPPKKYIILHQETRSGPWLASTRAFSFLKIVITEKFTTDKTVLFMGVCGAVATGRRVMKSRQEEIKLN